MSLFPEEDILALQQLARLASGYLDKLERHDSQELLSYLNTHWLISNDIFKIPTDQLMHLISQNNPSEDTSIILFPVDETVSPLCYREIHNIVRELTMGIYVFQQTPLISLEASYDHATICHIPPAYINTKIGQLLISVDYMMKALWHGAYFPKEKRTKFGERWRTNLDVNLLGVAETKKPLLSEFASAENQTNDFLSIVEMMIILFRLQYCVKSTMKYLGAKQETRRQLELLKLISCLVPFLLGMRKKMRIPDINSLMNPYNSDECRTERELPPLMVGPDFKCKNFMAEDTYFHLHGGINFDLETDFMEDGPEELENEYENICDTAMKEYLTHTSSEQQRVRDHYNIPTVTVNGKLILSLSDNYTPLVGLKICSQQGLLAMFSALTRKISGTKIGKQDEQGMSLIHYAAIYNRPQIIILLLVQSVDINTRRNNIVASAYTKTFGDLKERKSSIELVAAKSEIRRTDKLDGPTALHMAARCGSLDAACCLVSNDADMSLIDQDGWTPIHYAAFFDHKSILTLLLRKDMELLEQTTTNDISGLYISTMVNQTFHSRQSPRAGSQKQWYSYFFLPFHFASHFTLEMLNDEAMDKKDSAVKCLEILTTNKKSYWKFILEADGVPALVQLLQIDSDIMQSVAAAVICNISENDPVRLALSKAKAAPVLIKLLGSHIEDIQSRTAIILSDISCVENNQNFIAECGGIPPLVQLLFSDLEDVLVNAVNCIRVLCINNTSNQNTVAECGALEHLVEFLEIPSEDLQAGAAAALAAACSKNTENQNRVINEDAHIPLVELIKNSKSTTVQVKAASALEALASLNPASQKKFLELDAPKALIRLLKNVFVEVREQGACALWALAGNTKTQQKNIAERITITHIIQMLLEPTEKLLYVGCMTAIALGSENIGNQNKLAAADAFSQLVRLLRSPKTSIKVLHMVIKVLGILCVGVAFQNNKVTQGKIADEGGIPLLVHLLTKPPNDEIQVEVAITLGNVVLSNHENQEKLAEEATFKFDTLLIMLRSKDEEIRLRAGMALTIFAFNNTPQQMNMKHAGGISYDVFDKFIQSNDEFYQCYASFQIVVLARIIIDKDQVSLTAQGIMMLVSKLNSPEEKVVVLSCSLLAALSHTRAGLTDAMITCGSLDLLVNKLDSPNDIVRSGAAVALGYLTFNKTAYRLLFSLCRNVPNLFEKIMKNIGEEPKICQDFIEDFKRATSIGLPSQCLEINGGPQVLQKKKPPGRRPKACRLNANANNNLAVSAPPMPFIQSSMHTLPEIVEPMFKKETVSDMRLTSPSVLVSCEDSCDH
uniref:Uncharacterized protein n=1 Tax=Biomphalaria glabrata TaxID=6526 RepID=A0A2C9KYG2_BIOGL